MAISNATLATNLAGIIDDIAGESIYIFNSLAGILDCVKHVDTTGQQGIAFDFPIWGTVASSDINAGTEGTDYTTYKQMTVADTQAQVTEHQINAFVSDLSLLGASPRNLVVEGISKLFANGELAKLEDDVVGLFADFNSSNDLAGAATTMTIQHWLDGIQKLKAANANIMDLCAVISPKQMWGAKGLLKLLVDADADAGLLGEEAKARGWVTRAFGVDVRVSNEINEDVGSGGDAAGVIMDKSAVGVHSKGFFNIETQRDATARGFELVCVGRWKEVELHDTFGCYFLSDVA